MGSGQGVWGWETGHPDTRTPGQEGKGEAGLSGVQDLLSKELQTYQGIQGVNHNLAVEIWETCRLVVGW